MKTTGTLSLTHERVDDIPLLLGFMQQLNVPVLLEHHLGSHHLHRGLFNGWLATVWVAFLLSQANHRKVSVQDHKQYREEEALRADVAAMLKQHPLEGLLTVTWERQEQQQTRAATGLLAGNRPIKKAWRGDDGVIQLPALSARRSARNHLDPSPMRCPSIGQPLDSRRVRSY